MTAQPPLCWSWRFKVRVLFLWSRARAWHLPDLNYAQALSACVRSPNTRNKEILKMSTEGAASSPAIFSWIIKYDPLEQGLGSRKVVQAGLILWLEWWLPPRRWGLSHSIQGAYNEGSVSILKLKPELLSCEGGVLITSIFNAYNVIVDLVPNNPLCCSLQKQRTEILEDIL